ncbi:MAG TPA: lipopolysaccharide heptosyltransferase I [Thermoanaerobaculia bacterium]|nr:lipopolysaccharide heptosyltransferase I [Thermoanaerobaculia bacterium]
MRILVLRLSALGDVIHTIPAVSLLRPVADVTWVVEAPYAELVEIVTGVKTIPVRLKRWTRRPLQSRTELRRTLSQIRGFDAAVDFQGLIKSAVLTWLSRAPDRYGFSRELIREKPAVVFTNRRVTVNRLSHVIDWNRELARAVTSNRTPSEERWSDFAADPEGRVKPFAGRIVLLPGAGKLKKQWPVARFRALVHRYPGRTVVVWGPGERQLAEAIGGEIAPETNLRELAALLRDAQLVVGGDTGPLHLAVAMGAKVVGLYGPTDPARNGPYGQIASTVDHYRGGDRTMESIGVEEVIARMEERLG